MVYTFSLSRRSLPVRCLCVLLCLLVLWCFFLVPRVGAVVAEAELAYWGGAIVVSVLAAGGMALATGDAQKVGSAMYAALKDTGGKAWDSIQAMAAWAASAGSKVKDAAFRVGADVWQAITDCFNKSYSDGQFATGDIFTVNTVDDLAALQSYFNSHVVKSLSIGTYFSCDVAYSEPILSFHYVSDAFNTHQEDVLTEDATDWFSGGWGKPVDFGLDISISMSGKRFEVRGCLIHGNGSHYSVTRSYGYNIPLGAVCIGGVVSLPAPDLKYPGDDYLVKAPDLPAVDTATGAVSWPSDAVYNKDAIALPYPIDAAGRKVADIPYDVPVGQTTGKTLDDADTGTDTDKPGTDTDKPGADTGGLLGQIVALLKKFFDSPSDFKLDMDGFRDLAIKDKFPFCIPFDVVDSVKQFAADAADYQFRIKLDTQYFSVDHVVDLTPLAVPLAFFRYIVVTWFVWVLLSRTRDLMKW